MAIDQIKQSIDSQINSVVSSSPVATPPVVEDIKAVVPAEVSSVSQEGSVAGGEYGAVRRDSFSPSTQLSTGVKLSSDPRDVYSGGIVEAGRNVYADLPDSSDDFYLRVKYAPVKQYPLRMPDGNMYDVTTSDFRKAMWQFYMDKMGVPADADWFGYYYVPEQVRETFVGSMLRAIPNTATALGSDLASSALRAPAHALAALGIAPETSAAYDEIIKDIFDNVKDTLHVGDITEETANKYGSMTGSALFTVGAAILSGGSSAAVNTLAAAEAASAYNGIYDSLKNAGYSPASAFAMSVGGGLGVGLLSKAGSVGEKAMQASAGAGRGLVYAALKNPGELSRMAKRYVPYNALAEAITEPLQSELENFMSSGMSIDSLGENFDERLFEFFSALAIGAGAAYYNSMKMPAYEDRIRSYASDMRRTLEQIQKTLPYSSKGIITDEVLADLITVVNKPEFGRVAYEMMRESIYGQFDKVPKTERAKLMKTLSKLDSVAALEKEYTIFEERLDKLFVNSGLDTNVEAELRLLLRAVASWNLAKRGILPSKAPLPQKISVEPTRVVKGLDKDVAAGVAGHTLGDVIFLNPAVPSSPMVEQNIGKGLGAEPVNMAKSRSVMSEAARSAKGNPNVDQGRSAKVAYARHEVTHWIAENSGLQDVPRFMNALKRIANTVVPQFTKGKTGTELAEAYAVGMQYASEQAAKEVGLQGPVGEYIDFMHTMLYAQERAQGLQKDVQTYVETLRAVMAQNKEFVDELIKGFGSEKLRGAIKEFIKTGDSSLLDAETIKGLNAVLQSVADAQTQDNLETIFGSPNQMRDFSKQVAGIRSKANRQAAIEKADKRDQLRAEANVQVGLPENTKPTAAPTISEAASEIATEDVELPKAEAKTETKTEGMPERRKKSGEMYDIDELEVGKMSDQKLVDYRIHVAKWLSAEQATGVAPASRISALQRYNELSAAEVAKRKKAKRFTPEQAQALKDAGLYATMDARELANEAMHKRWTAGLLRDMVYNGPISTIFGQQESIKDYEAYEGFVGYEEEKSRREQDLALLQQMYKEHLSGSSEEDLESGKAEVLKVADKLSSEADALKAQAQALEDEGLYAVIEPNILKVDKLIDTLLDIPAEERTPAEQELYRAVAIYDTKSSEFVQGEFPDMSIYEINVELIKLAQDLDEALFQISAEPKSRVFGQINSLKKRLEGHIQFLEDNNHDIIMHDMLVADGILEPDYAGTTDDRTRAQKQYDKEMAAVEDLYKRAKKLEKSKSEADQYTALELKGKAERIRQGAERRLEIAKKAPRRSLGRLSHYFTPKYDSDFSSRMIGVQTVDSAYAFLKSGQGTEEQRAVAQKVVEQNRTLASYVNPARTVGKRPLLDTPSPLEEMGISVEEALQKIASAGLKPYEISESILGTEKERNAFIGKSYNLEESAPLTRSRIYAKLIDFMLHEDFGMKDIAESGDDAQMMRVLLAIHEAKYLANDMFARYLGREQSFDKNPSNNPITEAAVNEMKKERGKAQLKDHMQNLGYSEVALVHDLFVGDEVAYMGGNNFFRGIVSFKGRTPSGAMFYVIRKDVDVANQKSKKNPVSGMEERVVSASDLGRVGVVRKPASTQDAAHVKEVFDFYDEAYATAGRDNITKLAVLSVQEAEGDVDIYDAIDPLKREIAEELSSLDSPNVGLFAAGLSIARGDESGATKFIDDVDSKIAALNDKIKAVDSSIHNESYFDDWEGFQANKPESVAAEEAARNKAFAELREYDAEMERLQEQRKSFFANYTPAKRDAFIKERSRVEKEMAAISDRFVPFFKSFGPGLAMSDVDLLIESLEGRYDIGFQDDAGNIMPASVVRAELPENLERIKQLNTYSDALQDAITYGGTFANLSGNVPTVDPGAFAVIGGSLEDTMATYERSLELEEEYEASGLWYEGLAEQEALLAAEKARREDQLKPRFSDAVKKKNERDVSFLDQLDMLEKGLADTRVSKALYFLGSGSGTDRKGRLLFGKVWDKAFGLSKAYSYAQQRRELRVHLMDETVIKDVFGGNRKAYDKWRAEIKADRYDAVVNGNNVKISRDEIMSIYAMKIESERPGSANNQLSRLRKYSNIDGLIANLTTEDKEFVGKAVVEIRAAREGISSVPADWVPAVEMTTFVKDGWAGRKKSKINNERGFIESDTSIAALGLYDSTISSISRFATHASGLMAQLDNLKQILAFAGVDRSMYREFEGEDQKLYDDVLNRSMRLREAIAKKIGHTQAKWLLQGIEYDLTADPLSDDIGTAPGMEWFQKLTRGAASSALSLNLRQALQNLGNYHRFFGLSSSGGVKFYTADWINAVAHFKEAWALAMENPEFKRRFEQAGLSEHMRRIADVNQSSFLSEIQTKLYEKGKDGASNMVSTLNSLSAIGTKWGLATNVLPDMVGIALGNYAVWNDVLAKNGGNVAEAQKEIADFVNNRISSSNYMTQSLLKKRLNKMGLGALVMFQSDQLQSFGALAEAWSTLLNSKDAGERSMAKRDIASFVVSMGRYIAIKAGWVGALMATAMGRDLSDDEWDYIYESTAYELVAQMGGWSQFNNLGISPFIRSLMEGENFGPSIVTVSATGRLISDVRKGFKGDGMSFVDALGETLALSGIAPAFPALLRISDGIFKIASGDEHESAVGWKQVAGTSETGAMKQLGLSKSQKTGKIQPKKKLKKDGE